jgi:hypothetical protein
VSPAAGGSAAAEWRSARTKHSGSGGSGVAWGACSPGGTTPATRVGDIRPVVSRGGLGAARLRAGEMKCSSYSEEFVMLSAVGSSARPPPPPGPAPAGGGDATALDVFIA